MINTMNNKIYEEALTNLIRRMDELENAMKGIPKAIWNSKQPVLQSEGMATDKQRNYSLKLGGTWTGTSMTKVEAGEIIDRLLEERKVTDSHHESPIVTEPKEVEDLADETGIDEEGLM